MALKLRRAGIAEPDRASQAEQARKVLCDFLSRVDQVLSSEQAGVALGVDPRFRALAKGFDTGGSRRSKPKLSPRAMADMLAGFAEEEGESADELLDDLAGLRDIVSRHQGSDAHAILEEFL